jgi:hypothetical protein
MKGWVYVITNKAMPDLVKVGYSMTDPDLRAKELNHTGSPHPYLVEYELLIDEPRQVEQKTHKLLSAKHEGKEWFRCTPEEAVVAIRQIAGDRIITETNKYKRVERTKVEDQVYKQAAQETKDRAEAEQETKNRTERAKVEVLYQQEHLEREAQPKQQQADQGDALVQFNLGYMYNNGHGVTQDYAEAAQWWRKAADQGFAKAQLALGSMYESGHGVAQNSIIAYALYNISAASDSSPENYPSKLREIISREMTEKQIEQGQLLTNRMQSIGVSKEIMITEKGKKIGITEKGRKIWNTDQGADLVRGMLGVTPITPEMRQTIQQLKDLSLEQMKPKDLMTE